MVGWEAEELSEEYPRALSGEFVIEQIRRKQRKITVRSRAVNTHRLNAERQIFNYKERMVDSRRGANAAGASAGRRSRRKRKKKRKKKKKNKGKWRLSISSHYPRPTVSIPRGFSPIPRPAARRTSRITPEVISFESIN